MKKQSIISLFFAFGFIMLTFSSCQKFVEGGRVSKAETNLQASWKLDKYLKNSNDETGSLLIQNYVEVYAGNGIFSRSYTKNGETIAENGSWKFEKEAEKLDISGVGSVEITASTGTVSSSYYNIIKLDKNEFWYFYMNGSDRHEFRLIKK